MFANIPNGTTVFVDSNIFLYHFMDMEKFGSTSSNLLLRIENQEINGVTTVFNIAEVSHKLMITEAAQQLNKPYKTVVAYIKKHPEVICSLKRSHMAIENIVDFNIQIQPVTPKDIFDSKKYRQKYGLLTIDSILLSIIRNLGIRDIATNDMDFERVNFLTVWKP